MQTQISASEAMRQVRESVSHPKPDPISISNRNSIGEWVRQGDVYFQLVDGTSYNFNNLKPVHQFNGQLAPGNTRGSRHCLRQEDLPNVRAFEDPCFGRRENPEAGMILQVNADVEVPHPDHGTVKIGKDCTIRVTYQVNQFDAERARVQD